MTKHPGSQRSDCRHVPSSQSACRLPAWRDCPRAIAARARRRPPSPQLEQTLVDVIARAEPSVVAISRTSPASRRSTEQPLRRRLRRSPRTAPHASRADTVGAGVIIDRAGLVLTEYLAVREGDQHTVTTIDRKTYPAKIRAADPRSGLAVLAIDPRRARFKRAAHRKKPPPTASPPSASATPTTSAKASSSSPSATRTPSRPTASRRPVGASSPTWPAKRRRARISTTRRARRTTTARRSTTSARSSKPTPSSAGAPAAGHSSNLRGELVGLTTTAATIAGHEQPAGYAIPINATFRRIIDTLKEGREVEYGMLGVGFGQPLMATTIGQNRVSSIAPHAATSVRRRPGRARTGLANGRRRLTRRR